MVLVPPSNTFSFSLIYGFDSHAASIGSIALQRNPDARANPRLAYSERGKNQDGIFVTDSNDTGVGCGSLPNGAHAPTFRHK